MAHNIHLNEQTGEHSFFSVKEKAWHGLGKVIDNYPTSAEALKFAGLDFNVIKEDIYTTSFNADGQAMDFTQKIKRTLPPSGRTRAMYWE